jgi:hypothetical protein
MNKVVNTNNKWISWTIIFIITIYLYRQNKIQYSNKTIFNFYKYKFTYHHLLYYITITILVFHTMFAKYLSSTYLTQIIIQSWYIIPFIFGIITINLFKSTPIINNHKFNPPPQHLSKTNKYSYIIIILLIIYNIIIEIPQIKKIIQYDIKHIIFFIPCIINLIIYIYLFHLHNTFTICQYDLPISWS